MIKNILKLSIKNILSNKLRSFLTMLGLIIGITSVIVLVGLVNGTSSNISESVKSLGTNILTLNITSDEASIDYTDIDNIENLNNIKEVSPYKTVNSKVSYGEETSSRASLIATTPEYLDINELTISSGRKLSIIDIENNSKVCLIGSDMKDDLFDEDTATGKYIKIDGDKYRVIGVLTQVGSSMGNNIDDTIIIPFTTAKYLGSDTSINNLYIKVKDEDIIDTTTEMLENYIENTLGIDEDYYSLSSQDSMLSTMDDIDNTMALLMGCIAGISLIVGGIGVMNVMLVSVTERTKEIGIRKALGARRKDILIQFLAEALVICVIGGIIGIILGLGLGTLLGKMGYLFNPGILIIFISFLSCVLIGTIFGIYPANKASKLNPIEALRNE